MENETKATLKSVLTKEEFEEIVVAPIRAAYRVSGFLNEITEQAYFDYWYETLKGCDKCKLSAHVDVWVRRNSKIPVLADIAAGLV